MTFISTKKIKGKKQYYLEKSVRFPYGKVKKYSLYLRDYDPSVEYKSISTYKERLEKKISEEIISNSIKQFKTNYIFTEQTLQKLEEIKENYKKIVRQLTEKQFRDLLDRFTINFTYESNAIEGNSLTFKDVTYILLEEKTLRGKDLREIYETINTRKAVEWIFTEKPAINEKNIIKLHEILVKDTGITLDYKKVPNFLLGRTVETTPPEDVAQEMEKLVEEYTANEQLHPLQLAALLHGKFEKIHPFEDGNGRVGRLLINMMLLRRGYPPLIIRKTQRVRYFHALEAFDHGHADNLYRFVLEKYKETYDKFFGVYVKYLN